MESVQGQRTGRTSKGEGEEGTKARGRHAGGQPAVKQPKVVAENLDDLVSLYEKAQSAATKFKDAITATAEKSGYLASGVRKLVIAKAGEKFDEKHREVQQQAELFDEAAK